MGFEDDLEQGKSSVKPRRGFKMTLQKAVDMGEYNPKYLSTFPEWYDLSRHMQFQFVKQAIENRRKQLLIQYAEMNNVLDLRLKPEIKEAMKSVHDQLKKVETDREKLLVEYSK